MKYFLLLFCLLVFGFVQLHGQPNASKKDSLQQIINSSSNASAKTEAALALGDLYYATYTFEGYNKAANFYNEALEIASANNNVRFKAFAYKSLGGVYDALGDEQLPKALEFYQKANQIIESKLLADTALVVNSLTVLASVQGRLMQRDACRSSLDKALSFLNTNSQVNIKNDLLVAAAFFMSRLDEYDYCKQYFSKIVGSPNFINKTLPYKKYESLVQMYLLKTEGNFNSAYNFAKQALANVTNVSDSLELYNQLADYAYQAKNYNQAYQMRDIEFQLYRKIIKADALKSVSNELLKSELILKEENSKLLQKQKNLQQQFNYWLLAGLLLTGILAAIIFRFAAQIRNKNKLLLQQNENKALLLGEIHHRIKNNLEMLQSMLLLQMREYKDSDEVQTALTNANSRILSMAILHKQLYAGDFSKTNINLYFTEMLDKILADVNNKRTVQISYAVNIESVELKQDTVLPLAMLINECITNSLKYAFGVENEQPILKLEITRVVDTLHMIYSDNGKAAIEVDAKKVGFGSRLITSLARQLNGKIMIDRTAAGWQTSIDIPVA
jgi:two-component sensor histidine kinase